MTNKRLTSEEQFLEAYGDYRFSIVLGREWVEREEYMYSYMDVEMSYPWNHNIFLLSTLKHQWSPFKVFGFINEDNFWMWREWMRMKGSCPDEDKYRWIELNALAKIEREVEVEVGYKFEVSYRGDVLSGYLHDSVDPLLFPHVSKSNPGMVSFTPSARHGREDRQIVMKIGKFLNRYTDLNPVQVKDAANEFMAKYGSLELNLASGAEIEDIYLWEHVGFTSCMDSDHSFPGEHHPACVYDSPDIKLAYLGDKKNQKLYARALINVKSKEFSVVYGNEQLEDLLINKGYKSGDLLGCRLKKVRVYEAYSTEYYMPYIDGESGIADDGDWWRVSDICDFYADDTSGVTHTDTAECSHCCASFNSESLTEAASGELLCEYCIGEYYVMAVTSVSFSGIWSSELVHVDDAVYSYYHRQHFHSDLIDDDIMYSNYHDDYFLDNKCHYSEWEQDYLLPDDGDVMHVTSSDGDEDYILQTSYESWAAENIEDEEEE